MAEPERRSEYLRSAMDSHARETFHVSSSQLDEIEARNDARRQAKAEK